jgi:hypothetical protein
MVSAPSTPSLAPNQTGAEKPNKIRLNDFADEGTLQGVQPPLPQAVEAAQGQWQCFFVEGLEGRCVAGSNSWGQVGGRVAENCVGAILA